MIEREFAMRTVQEFLDHENPGQLLVTGAEEHELVWIVTFQSAEFVRSGDHRDFFVGHGPYVVDRVDGSVHAVGSAAALNREWEHDYRARIRGLPVRTAVDALHEELRATLAAHGRIPAIRLLRTRVPALSPTQAAPYTTALPSGPLAAIATKALVPEPNPVHRVRTVRAACPEAGATQPTHHSPQPGPL
ncbi:YrhB domain-containing protein [Streptomyces rimosus]